MDGSTYIQGCDGGAAGSDAATAVSTPCRIGPRPLALHLQLARVLAIRDGGADGTAHERLAGFLDGLKAYWRHPAAPLPAPPRAVWQEGSARLLDYGAEGGSCVLILPSLVNRATILDLTPRHSLTRHLAAQGLRPLLLDWGSPDAAELGSGLDELICGRASRALDVAIALGGGRPALLGYCMGGTMAVALARHRQADLAGLACLAAPWNFHRGSTRQLAQVLGAILPLTLGIGAAGAAPVELLQAFFAASDTGRIAAKFAAFGRLPAGDPRAELFVAVEAWLADGVPLPGPVAMQCLWDWYMGNRPAHGQWRVGGAFVRPQELRLPTLVAIPERDRIVPAASAEALAAQLADPVVLRPSSGHIGMIVGETARAQLWPDLVAWLRHIALGRGVRYKRPRVRGKDQPASPRGRRARRPRSPSGPQEF